MGSPQASVFDVLTRYDVPFGVTGGQAVKRAAGRPNNLLDIDELDRMP